MRTRNILVAVALVSACGNRQHVELEPVVAHSPQARRQAYERLKPARKLESVTYYQSVTTGAIVGEEEERLLLVLGDGTRVDFPEDLLPLVGADSATAVSAVDSASHRKSAYLYGGLAALSGVGALGLLASPLVFDRTPGARFRVIGGLVGIAAAISLTFFANARGDDERAAASEAYETYDADLRANLALPCDDCDAPPGSAPRR